MNFMGLMKILENFSCEYDLQDVEVTAAGVEGVYCLIFKHSEKVFDVIVLEDSRFNSK